MSWFKIHHQKKEKILQLLLLLSWGGVLCLHCFYQQWNENKHQHSKNWKNNFYYLKMCKYVFFLLYCWCLDSGWNFLFGNWFTVCCWKYIQFKLERRLNSVLLLWMVLSGLWNKVIFIFWTWAKFHVFYFFFACV